MMRHIPFKGLYKSGHGWLESHFHFSFAEYYDKDNIHYGVLRVMNDDIIKPFSGFPTHPHRDMEIITYVLSGELTHEDSMGYKETLGRGALQYMSAGTGIMHSEKNEGENDLHLIQIWIHPRVKGLDPQYGSKMFDLNQRHNRWLQLIGSEESDAEITMYQDANVYVSELDESKELDFELGEERQVYLKVMEGSADISGRHFQTGDAGEISDETISIVALSDTHILLVEMSAEI